MLKRPFWRKNRRKHNSNICRRNNNEGNSESENREFRLSETAPSCNDWIATVVTERFTQTVKGVGTACVQPSGKEKKTLFPRIQESGGVAGGELKLFT